MNKKKNLKIIVATLGAFCPGAQTHISIYEFLGENKIKSKLMMPFMQEGGFVFSVCAKPGTYRCLINVK